MVRFGLPGSSVAAMSETFSSFVNPDIPIPVRIQQITGISDADVADALHFNALRLQVEEFIGEATIVGQNVGFDLAFLAEQGLRPPGAVLDTLELAALLEPPLKDRSLGALAAHYDVEMPVAHRALADADATRAVFLAMYERARQLPDALLTDLIALDSPLLAGVPEDEAPSWPVALMLRGIATQREIDVAPRRTVTPPSPSTRGRPSAPSPQRNLDQLVAERVADEQAADAVTQTETGVLPLKLTDVVVVKPPAPQPARPERVASLADEAIDEQALAVLRAGGARPDLFGSFEERPEQIGMTRSVARAIEGGEHLLVEAGTGTGKSLAYLIPAALWALRNGRRVIVSTNTINLQEQLVQKDAPALVALLRDGLGAGLGEEAAGTLRVVTLKGRRNYLCLRRVAQERVAGPASDAEAALLGRLLVWLQQTESGDRGELVLSSEEDQLWGRYSAEGEDCLTGGNCPFVREGTCFMLRARRAAEAAHIVIINHALLLSDLAAGGTALPAADTIVIDEAHHLEDAATTHLGETTSLRSLAEPLDGVHRISQRGAAGGLVVGVEMTARDRRIDESTRSGLRSLTAGLPDLVAQARSESEDIFRLLRRFTDDQADDRFNNSSRLRLTRGVRAQPEWSQIEIAWDGVFESLRRVAGRLEELERGLEEVADELSGGEDDGDGRGDDWESLLGEARSLRETLTERAQETGALLTQFDPEAIVWTTTQRRGELATLSSAPLRVDALLAEQFFDQKRSVVLTGATLTTEGTYDYLRERVGLPEAAEEHFGSPFDYRRAVRLLLPSDMPEPSDSAYPQALAESIIDLARASEGRALVLFTAHGALRQAADAIRAELQRDEITVIAQGLDGSPRRILRELAANPRSVVLGAASLWEGVDVPGDAISLVVIARLPFPVPSDPVYAARAELYEDPFQRCAVPQSIVRFRQGFGRLIRRKGDRGVVAVLDGRVTSRRYGRSFVASLPPAEVVELPRRDLGAAVSEFLNA